MSGGFSVQREGNEADMERKAVASDHRGAQRCREKLLQFRNFSRARLSFPWDPAVPIFYFILFGVQQDFWILYKISFYLSFFLAT